MNLYRIDELKAQGVAARWLDEEKSKNAYVYATQFLEGQHYGLKQAVLSDFARLEIDSPTVADAWLKRHCSSEGTVQIVFGSDEVCVISARDFLDNWRSIFVPARDDALIVHNADNSIIFYCHEDEFEFGRRSI